MRSLGRKVRVGGLGLDRELVDVDVRGLVRTWVTCPLPHEPTIARRSPFSMPSRTSPLRRSKYSRAALISGLAAPMKPLLMAEKTAGSGSQGLGRS